MKRISFVMSVLVIAALLCLNVFSVDEQFMSHFWEYTAAASEGDPDKILAAVNVLDEILPNPSDVDGHNKMIWAVFKAAPICEEKGDFDKALYYYEKFVKYATYLMENDGQDFAENIKLTEAIIRHLSQVPEVYVACDNPADVPYYGSKHEPEYGTFFGKCAEFEEGYETGHLIYVQFFNETIASFHYLFPSEPVYTLIAWNVPNENKGDLDAINSGAWDDYVISDLKFLSTLEHKILLRFGAEGHGHRLPQGRRQLHTLGGKAIPVGKNVGQRQLQHQVGTPLHRRGGTGPLIVGGRLSSLYKTTAHNTNSIILLPLGDLLQQPPMAVMEGIEFADHRKNHRQLPPFLSKRC